MLSLKSSAITGGVVGLLEQQPKQTTKKLQLKIVSFINGNISNILASVFMKFTAQQIKFDVAENHPLVLDRFRMNSKDRTYQFWERNPLGIEWYSMMYYTKAGLHSLESGKGLVIQVAGRILFSVVGQRDRQRRLKLNSIVGLLFTFCFV